MNSWPENRPHGPCPPSLVSILRSLFTKQVRVQLRTSPAGHHDLFCRPLCPAVPLSKQDSAGGRHGLSAPLSALQGPRAELGTPGPCFSSFPGVPCCSDDTRGDFLASSVTAVGFICQWKCSLPFFLALKVLCEIG